MAEQSIQNTTSRRGEARITIVPSLTSSRAYKVTDASCSCSHFEHTGAMCKHRVLRSALEAIRALPRPEASRDMIEERVLRLAKRIYTRPRKTETAASSYDLLLEVYAERFATEAIREAARHRHGVVSRRLEVAA